MTTIAQIIADKAAVSLAKADSQLLTELQAKLASLNYYLGKVDGLYGARTQGAWRQFKISVHQGAFDVVGQGSLNALNAAKPRVLTPYASGYNKLWYSASVNPGRIHVCDYVIDSKFTTHLSSYEKVESATGVPWFVVAVIHAREADCDFSCHLFNGDPLTHRTVNVPAGQPSEGNPPFDWYVSAIASLKWDGLDKMSNWSLESILYQLEKYNGLGYFNRGINSPYVWAGTNQYSCGKYVSDGRFDPKAVDGQLGCAALLKRMNDRGIITI